MKGGYTMIDLTGLDVATETGASPVEITGVFKKLSDAYDTKKPVIAINLVNGEAGDIIAPTNINLIKTADAVTDKPVFMFSFISNVIAINEDDEVAVQTFLPTDEGSGD